MSGLNSDAIETYIKAISPKLYHTGIRRHIPRSTHADANEKRDQRICMRLRLYFR